MARSGSVRGIRRPAAMAEQETGGLSAISDHREFLKTILGSFLERPLLIFLSSNIRP